jgi:hypothetical protein
LSREPLAWYFTLSTQLVVSLYAFRLYSALQSLELYTGSSLIQYTLLWHASLPNLPRDTNTSYMDKLLTNQSAVLYIIGTCI